MEDDDVGYEWAWGKGQFDGKIVLFNSNLAAGGYKCSLCNLKLDKRFDNLMKHIKSAHEALAGNDVKVLTKGIPRIKIKCPFCKKGFDLTGGKEARHLAVCQARIRSTSGGRMSASGEDSVKSKARADRARMEVRETVGKIKSNGEYKVRQRKIIDYKVLAGKGKVLDSPARKKIVHSRLHQSKHVTKSKLEKRRNKVLSVEPVTKERSLVRADVDSEESVEILEGDEKSDKEINHRKRKVVDYRALAGMSKASIMVQPDKNTLDVETPKISSEMKPSSKESATLTTSKAKGMLDMGKSEDLVGNKNGLDCAVNQLEGDDIERITNLKKEYDEKIQKLRIDEKRHIRIIEDLKREKYVYDKEKKAMQTENYNLMKAKTALGNKVKDMKRKIEDSSKIDKLDFKKVKVIKVLGEGTFGKVKKAEYKGQLVALKEMTIHWTTLIEMIVSLKVKGDNLVGATCIGIDWNELDVSKSKITIGMEVCDTDLQRLMNRKRGEKRGTKESIGWKIDVLFGSAQALDQLHSIPIIHRDIKPENLLMKGNTVKLADYGLSELGDRGWTRSGTPGYISPEVLDSERLRTSYSTKADVWSLGAVFHEILVDEYLVQDGKNEEECHNPNQQWKDAEPPLMRHAELCKMMLIQNPKHRISAYNFLSKLTDIKM